MADAEKLLTHPWNRSAVGDRFLRAIDWSSIVRRRLAPRVSTAVFVTFGQAKRHEPEYFSPAKPIIGAGVMLHLNRRVAAQVEFSQIVGLSLDTISVTARPLDCSSGQCVAGPSMRITGRDGTSAL
jgi:hypothetical protein